jgi:DNA-binding HxlR family transcriptional regulator
MDKPNHRVTTCINSLKLLADFWSLRIIEALATDQKRYCELQRALDNVNPATLTKKLAELESANLLVRTKETNGHNVHYQLTALGQEALPVLEAIQAFSKKYEQINKK